MNPVALRDYLRGAAAPPAPIPHPAANTEVDRWAADAARVRELWRGEQFATALAILEQLAHLTGADGAKYAEWARQEIPKVRTQIEHANQTIVQATTRHSAKASHRLSPRIQRPTNAKPSTPSWQIWVLVTSAMVIVFLTFLVVSSNWKTPSSGAVADAARIVDAPAAKLAVQPTPFAEEDIESNPVTEMEAADNPIVIEPPTAPPAVGQRPPPPPEEGNPLRRPPPRPNVDDIMSDLDANNDGQLTPKEIPGHERLHLMRADTDRDGVVTREELDIMFLFTPGPPPRR